MTYAHLESGRIKRFKERYSFKELKDWFTNLVNEYAKWVSGRLPGMSAETRAY